MAIPQRSSKLFGVIISICLCLSSNMCASRDNNDESNGLTLKLISRFSTFSPIHQVNLTRLEILRRQRAPWLSSTYETTNKSEPYNIRPKVSVTFNNEMYAVKAFVGTPPVEHYLLFDTGSDYTWIQCEGCHKCFHIKDGNFTPARSSTYKEIAYNDPRCDTKIRLHRNKCGYEIEYTNDDYTEGVVSTDSFAFDGSHGRPETISNVIFGCGLKNNVNFENNARNENTLSGVLGMGRGLNSFVSQLGRKANGRFSYCVQPANPRARVETTLQFGNDATFKKNSSVQTTPLIKVETNTGYFLHLKDISVNGKEFRLPRETFRVRRDGNGGLFSDMGTTITRLYKTPYERLKREFIKHFRAQNLERKITEKQDELCYRLPNKTVSWPTATFHFQGADLHLNHEAYLHLNHEALFMIENGVFCMAFICSGANDAHAIFGSAQQVGYRFLIDVKREFMQFAADDCNS